ncbi:MAG: phosphopantetheine-binding protein [Butyrivibrio sp.]
MREKVLNVLYQVNKEIEKNIDKDLLATGLIDSYEIVNLVVELEEAFDIEIDPELVVPENFQTVDKIVELINGIIG